MTDLNGTERRLLAELGGVKAWNAAPSGNGGARAYGAICYDWRPAELGRPYRIDLRVEGVALSETKVSEEVGRRNVHIHLPGIGSSRNLTGSSEAVGLLPKSGFYYDPAKVAVFERNLADLLCASIWEMCKSGVKRILLRGPLFPKLVGRLGYLHLDRHLLIAAISYDPEYFPQVPLRSLSVGASGSPQGAFFASPEGSARYYRADLPPNTTVAECMRSWGILSKAGGVHNDDPKMPYVVQIFSQFPYGDQMGEGGPLWDAKLGELEGIFARCGLVFHKGEALWLPLGLACAHDRCTPGDERVQASRMSAAPEDPQRQFLFRYERDAEEMYRDDSFTALEIVCRRACLYLAPHDDTLFEKLYRSLHNALGSGSDETAKRIKTVADRNATLTKLIARLFEPLDKKRQSEDVVRQWKRVL